MFRFDAADIPGEVVRSEHMDHGYSLTESGQAVGLQYLTISREPLLTPLRMSYEAAKKRAERYNTIVGELPDMRRQTVVLTKNALPLTIQELMSALQSSGSKHDFAGWIGISYSKRK